MHSHESTQGPQAGPQTEERPGRCRHGHGHGQGPGGECGPARFRFGGRGEGGRGGGSGRGHGPHGFGPGFGRGPWSRAKRGDIRAAILMALADEPMHGYQIMQKFEERTGGAWRPSPGSVYPTLQLLEDQGLVEGAESEGRRVFSLTEAGKTEAGSLKEKHGDSPWGEGGETDPRLSLAAGVLLRSAGRSSRSPRTGTPDDVQKAIEILRDARKTDLRAARRRGMTRPGRPEAAP